MNRTSVYPLFMAFPTHFLPSILRVPAELSALVTTVASLSILFFYYCFGVPTNKLPEAICSKVAQLLKHQRQQRGLSLNILAQKAGLSRQMVSYVEQEKRIPSLYILVRISLALDIDLGELIQRATHSVSNKGKE